MAKALFKRSSCLITVRGSCFFDVFSIIYVSLQLLEMRIIVLVDYDIRAVFLRIHSSASPCRFIIPITVDIFVRPPKYRYRLGMQKTGTAKITDMGKCVQDDSWASWSC